MSDKITQRLPKWTWLILPVVLLLGSIALFFATNPLEPLGVQAPPIEEVTVERTVLDEEGIHLTVRVNGSEPVKIAQVLVDDAYWEFTQTPKGSLSRLSTAKIDIPYPWVRHELHEIKLITSTGATFSHTIEIAEPTPAWSLQRVGAYILLGIYIGVIPVGLGLLFYPYLKTLGSKGLNFLLTLTIGLLAYLFIDTLQEGFEISQQTAGVFSGNLLVWLTTGIAFLIIFAVGRRGGQAPEGLSLATYLAFGIGLHNLGEGLAVGAAMASGEAALGSFLVVGFTLHNLTEGIGIAAPLLSRKTSFGTFVNLTLLAGLPAAAGTLIGAFSYAPHWGAILFAIGAGAILQVIVEVGVFLTKNAPSKSWFTVPNLTGFVLGVAIMYGTALLVAV
ncbi:ZIP family metal transporter [Aliifodinibius sp. S!AR15-10]|uniref:ZIP family metal transporter n=1 Tax=Aliifodinibius sp. S!AR15-10 TaxID=2950437 RepID=UPI00285EC8FC|nr:ZIP family metal transporter [Aliifodinibius sp. S!AR15-10]MDR8391224.1 ZIP family metal transporter [Aliifodinibius sp. S!AR15-10]